MSHASYLVRAKYERPAQQVTGLRPEAAISEDAVMSANRDDFRCDSSWKVLSQINWVSNAQFLAGLQEFVVVFHARIDAEVVEYRC